MPSIVAEVRGNDVGPAAGGFDRAPHFAEPFRVSARQNDFRAGAREGQRERAPNSLARAGDDGQAAVKPERGQIAGSRIHAWSSMRSRGQCYLVRPVVVSSGCTSFTSRSSNGYVV